CGSATRLRYHTGCCGAPPIDATTAYSPSCSTRINADLRSLAVLRPRVVSTTIGLPWSSAASLPPLASNSSTCLLTQSHGLGTYSPSSGTAISFCRHYFSTIGLSGEPLPLTTGSGDA